jgi:polyphosphate glucokinase
MINELNVFFDAHALFEAAAADFCQYAQIVIKSDQVFRVLLSGGKTPIPFFDLLASDYKEKIPWQHIQFFFSDERYVPADHPDSNYHMIFKHLFSKLPVPLENIFPIATTFQDPQEAASHYDHLLHKVLQSKGNELSTFDLCYLGLGKDGHTASLMPGSEVVQQYARSSIAQTRDQLVASLWFAKESRYRITLTPPAINASKKVVFLVVGENKAFAVSQVLSDSKSPIEYPAQLIHAVNGKLYWYLDQPAASKIKNKTKNFQRPLTLCIDIGGTDIKMMIMDDNRKPVTDYLLELVPHPPTLKSVLKLLQNRMASFKIPFDRISAGFPGVIRQNTIETAHNMHPSWLGVNLQEKLENLTGKPTRVANDADIQGFGDIKGKGLEMVITLGTGVGSALFLNGKLVPNLELGHHPFIENKTYEELLGKKAFATLGIEQWNAYLKRAISLWDQTFNYNHLYLGGGNAENVKLKLPPTVTLCKNIEGVLGGIALWE